MTQLSTILIVDDDDDFRLLTRKHLERDGYRVKEASSGNEAMLVACSSISPDLILLDAEMPVMNGFDACRRFRLHPLTAKTPILMVTAFTDGKSVDKAFSAGVEDFFTKPVNWPILRQRIHHILEAKKTNQILAENEARFRKIYEGIPLSYLALDENRLILEVNQRWLSLFGYKSKEVVGQRFDRFLSTDYQNDISQILMDFKHAREINIECEMVCKNGEIRVVAIHGQIDKNKKGSERCCHYLLNDITRQSQLLNSLQHSDRKSVV